MTYIRESSPARRSPSCRRYADRDAPPPLSAVLMCTIFIISRWPSHGCISPPCGNPLLRGILGNLNIVAHCASPGRFSGGIPQEPCWRPAIVPSLRLPHLSSEHSAEAVLFRHRCSCRGLLTERGFRPQEKDVPCASPIRLPRT